MRTILFLILLTYLVCPGLAADQPFVSATMNTAQLTQGDPFLINGTASVNASAVYLWIFGPSFQIMGVSVPVSSDQQFRFAMPGEMTRTLKPGQYYAIVQDPMANGVPDVMVGDNSTIMIRSNASYRLPVASLSPDVVVDELKTLFSQPEIDDSYTKLTFTVNAGAGLGPTAAGTPVATPPVQPVETTKKATLPGTTGVLAACISVFLLFYRRDHS